MTSGLPVGDILRGLTFRVLFFLSLALLPIGLIAIGQARQISDENTASGELSLLAVTEQAATAERRLLQQAFGAADALASIVQLHRDNPEECSEFFAAYLESTGYYNLAGFIDSNGIMDCSSSYETVDLSDTGILQHDAEKPIVTATRVTRGVLSDVPSTLIKTPVFEDAEIVGFVALSIPKSSFERIAEPLLPAKPLAVVTVNNAGDLLTTERDIDLVRDELPATAELVSLLEEVPAVIFANNLKGTRRAFAIQPIMNDAAYAISVWPVNSPFLQQSTMQRLGPLLPILMWAASLVVAFLALNRLAIRHIRKLGRQMRRFAVNRNLPRNALGAGVPSELVQMEAAFIHMGDSILRDEAHLEDSLREKNILLKEVHHRVKNNLQLISSIMNMQIRQAKSDDSRRILRRLQERILSLATVHKNLYQNDDLSRVEAGVLLKEIVNQSLSVGLPPNSGVEVKQNYDDISLNADDAAPLTLLTSEAVTNALKHTLFGGAHQSDISIQLIKEDEKTAVLSISNTLGHEPEDEGTGLGSRLIEAFTRQLNGQVEVEQTADRYTITVRFPLPDLVKEVYDY